MISPQFPKDDVMNCSVGLVPIVVVAVRGRGEVDQSCGGHCGPLQGERQEAERGRGKKGQEAERGRDRKREAERGMWRNC